MKIEKLRREAVRRTARVNDVVHLSGRELRQVVGGFGRDFEEEVPPEICAIHDYYIQDSVS